MRTSSFTTVPASAHQRKAQAIAVAIPNTLSDLDHPQNSPSTMSSTTRTLARPLRSLVIAARPVRTFATLPTKNPTPSGPIEPSRTQAHPIGAFYEAILNTPELLPETKPEEPASSVKEASKNNNTSTKAATTEPPETTPATKRGRKAKPVAAANTAASKTSVSTTSSSSGPSSSSSSAANATTIPTTTTEPSTEEKAKVIFSSTLAGPAERAERLAQIRSKSTIIAGVIVPPKPEEPDNCCMSGCVNCVWERFRDEMEAWAAANAEAEGRLAAGKSTEKTQPRQQQQGQPAAAHTIVSMDDDGGGSETNWGAGAVPTPVSAGGKMAKDFWDDELYKNVPVGIREFMKQEKKLKEKHLREGTSSGNNG